MSHGSAKGVRGSTGPQGGGVYMPQILFGDGLAGTITLAGTTGLDQDLFANNLAITSTGLLNTNGWRIFVRNQLQLDAGGVIASDGGIGGSGGLAAGGIIAGLGATSNYLRGGFNGGTGAFTLRGSGGTTGSPHVMLGGTGGQGGSGFGVGGGGGAGMNFVGMRARPFYWPVLVEGYANGMSGTIFYGGGGGGGAPGGSGAVGSPGITNMGGGGGGGGGVIVILANTVINGGIIGARGGTGGIGPSGFGGGPGGGGGGGAVILVHGSYTGIGTLSAAGGPGGRPAGGIGTTGGSAMNGVDGRTFRFSLS